MLRVLSQSDDAVVDRVADSSPEVLRFVQRSYPGVKTFPSDERVHEDPSVDAVVIATPAADHYRAAKRALIAGKHVFVEKPLAMTEVQATELVELSKSKSLVLMVGHTFLYNSAVRRIKKIIDSGELGDIYYIYSRRLNLGMVRQDVNVLWNLAPHDISVILYWMETEPISCTASGGTFLQSGIEDVVFLTLSFPNRTIAHIHLSWLDPHKVRDMTVVGSKKMVVFDDVSTDAKVTVFDMGVDVRPDARRGVPFDSFGAFQVLHRYGDTLVPRIDYPEPLVTEMQHFVECIRTGREPLTGGNHAVSVVRTLELAQSALQRNDNLTHMSPRDQALTE